MSTPTPVQAPLGDPPYTEEQRDRIDTAYDHYKNSGAKLRDEVARAVALEQKWERTRQ